MELAKAYEPREAQAKWLDFWQQQGYFHAKPDGREPFSIVIPPPNVTGALHMGHALNNTLQDVLTRFRRMQGYNALWMPGTDHAGIATQAVVERLIQQTEKKTRHDIGREELVKRIWDWKDKYEARILGQLRQLGSSCDWERTRFTLDPVCARAVRQTFFNMFKDNLIFRGKRLVNWDAQLQTSVADDETFDDTIKGGFWTFKYPIEADPNPSGEPGVLTPGAPATTSETEFIRFSTTRPETMLGDTAVCVHPSDERYQHLIGKNAIIPLNGRKIPVIADGLLADPTLGTGCVKVTPAHDKNDYACGLRNKLPMINILNPDGTINANGGKFEGLDRYKAREAVVAEMETLGYFEGREDRDITMPFSDRSKTPIEPYLSDQWFVRMTDLDDGKPGLAQIAMDAVTDGRVKIFPERYAKTYLDWLGEKRDWCISRQLWWGHRIPIWYVTCPEAELKKAFANRTDVAWKLDEENGQWLLCATEDIPEDILGAKYPLRRDPDVLDTWFSSALWPHSTFGWPGPRIEGDQPPSGQNPEWNDLQYYYPTSILITSRDIITLWVARMVITGLYNVGKVPFHHVYIHPKMLDGFGETMSKSKGNGIDPLDIIERYGADALRFGIANIATETQDSRLPVANVCPHCDTLVPVKQEHMYMRTKKLACPSCKQPFRPGGPWPTEDAELKTAKQASDRFEIGRNFANKIWNAARFILMNLEGYTPAALDVAKLPIEDQWILSRLSHAQRDITDALNGYHFADAAKTLYEFIWTEFCDWYVEMAKGRLKGEGRAEVQRVLLGVLDAICRLIHPIMPFIAETVWQVLNEASIERVLPSAGEAEESVAIANWPTFPPSWQNTDVETRIGRMQELIRAVREVRNRYNIDPKKTLEIHVTCSDAVANDFRSLSPFISQLAGVGTMQAGPSVTKPAQSTGHVDPAFTVYVSLAGLIDPAAESKRIDKQLAEKRKAMQGAKAKLDNANFVKNAPPEVVDQMRGQLAEYERQIANLEEDLKALTGK